MASIWALNAAWAARSAAQRSDGVVVDVVDVDVVVGTVVDVDVVVGTVVEVDVVVGTLVDELDVVVGTLVDELDVVVGTLVDELDVVVGTLVDVLDVVVVVPKEIGVSPTPATLLRVATTRHGLVGSVSQLTFVLSEET